jgi:hypothetical protein
MSTLPSDAEYRDYFGRFGGKLLKHLFPLGGEHMLGVILALAILAFQWYYGLIPAEHGWKEIKSIGWPYVVLIGILFLLFVFRTPVELDSEAQKRINELSKKLELPDKALTEHLQELLSRVGSNERKVSQFLLWHGETTERRIKISGLTDEEISKSLHICFSENLIKTRYVPPTTPNSATSYIDFDPGITFYFVHEEIKNTLRHLL